MENLPEKKPFWSPSYAKPIFYASVFGLVVFVGLTMAVEAITPPAEARLQRGWPVSGKYTNDSSKGRRNSWATKIDEEYVVCVGSAYGGKTDCSNWYEGKLVVAERVLMPSLDGDTLVIAELREGSRVLETRSDAELISLWRSSSFSATLSLTFMTVVLVAMVFSILGIYRSPGKQT
ncbi:MAG: hypothetical protein O9327_06495 [Polaromonas sp.]|nr:hypothetical protein [Polaromonas sp.]